MPSFEIGEEGRRVYSVVDVQFSELNITEVLPDTNDTTVSDEVYHRNSEFDPLADAISSYTLEKDNNDIENLSPVDVNNSAPLTTLDLRSNISNTIENLTYTSGVIGRMDSGPATPTSMTNSINHSGADYEGREGSRRITVTTLIKKPFINNLEKLSGSISSGHVSVTRDGDELLIRPKPETVAKIFILPEWTKSTRYMLSTGEYDKDTYATTDFALLQIQEQEAEKYQIIETFGDDILYFYGKRPTVYNFSGNLINTNDHQWKNDFYYNYQEIMRGSKCAENKTRMYILYDDVIVEGYILNLSMTMNANETKLVPFSFSMFITNQVQVDTNELDTVIPATPEYLVEQRRMRDIMEYWDVQKDALDIYRTDADRAYLAQLQADRDSTEIDSFAGLLVSP